MKKIYLLLFTSLLTSFVIGQNIAFEQVLPLPPAPQIIANFDWVDASSIAFADIDNDNDQDVLITGASNAGIIAKLYTNDGNGNFVEVTETPFVGVTNGSIAFADIDNDNDQDVLITGSGTARLYTNDGSGFFAEVTGTPFDGVYGSSIAFADIDNDNDQDVLIVGSGSAKLYTNDGNGNFEEITWIPFVGVENSSIAFADIDNDNDQDVLITGENSSGQPIAKLYINIGGIMFYEEVTGTPFDGVEGGSIAFSDIDNDNDQDVLITGKNSSEEHIAKLYTNDGSGNFAEVTGMPFDGVSYGSIAFSDIDNDNDQDLLITGENSSEELIAKLYTNDGSGNFAEVTGMPFDGVYRGSVAFADIDNDNDQDVLITGYGYDGRITTLYINDGSGNFAEVTGSPFDGIFWGSIAFADIDNDNDQDVLITGRNSSNQFISKLYTNDGDGNYTEVTGTPFDGVTDGYIAFTDIDNDNNQDVLITGATGYLQYIAKLYTNDGSGNFVEVTGTPFDGVTDGSIAFSDIDNDNDQDVLITGKNSSEEHIAKLYTNNGSGNFAEVTGTPFEGVGYSSIAFADIDNDNDQDVLITGYSYPGAIAKLYTNDGDGNYTEVAGTPFDGVKHSSIAFSDIDNDNDKDVLITGNNSSYQDIAKLYTNDGNGMFTELIGTPFDGVCHSSIAFSDIDNDNDQDVLITGKNSFEERIAKLYTNDGSGNFEDVMGMPFDGVYSGSIAFSDIDNDNDQDVLITGVNSISQPSTILYRNITVSTGGLEENTLFNSVSIFPNPNPNQGLVNIDLGNLLEASIKVFNVNGQLIYHKENINTAIFQFEFNEAPGVYFVEVNSQSEKQQLKLIKK